MTAFLEAGHDAYSCDLLPASGKHPERHLQMDYLRAIEKINPDFFELIPQGIILKANERGNCVESEWEDYGEFILNIDFPDLIEI